MKYEENAELPVWDRADMMARFMDDEDLASRIIAVFLEDIPKRVEALRNHLETGNAEGAERESHSIKGASANLGAERLRAVACEIEDSARAGDMQSAGKRLDALTAEFDRLKSAVSPS